MTIVDFENVKVTTMTVIINIDGEININNIFPLLPITKLNLTNVSKSSKKFKIPWPGPEHAGKIFSAKYSGINRGIIKKTKDKSFRNSIGIDICTSCKNIAGKLSKNNIHMCGTNSEALAIETAEHLINHVIKIQEELDYISEHISERNEVIQWLIAETKGESFIINQLTQEIIKLEEGEIISNSLIYDKDGNLKYNYKEIPFVWEKGDTINPDNVIVNKYGQPYYRSLTKKEKKEGLNIYPLMVVDETMIIKNDGDKIPEDIKGNKFNKVSRFPEKVIGVTSVKYPDSVINGDKLIFPDHINPRIASFLFSYIQDYAYHHVFIDFLKNLKKIKTVFNNKEIQIHSETPFMEKTEKLPLKIGNLNIAMINYSYSVNMNINRKKLRELIDGYKGKYKAVFNNTTDHHVTITVPYEVDREETIKRKESSAISFMVYKSGIVTQSGPSPAIMKDVYYEFMEFIDSVRDSIKINDNKSFNIKYKPSF